MAPIVDPDNKKLFILLILAGIIMIGLIVYAIVTYSTIPGPTDAKVPATGTPAKIEPVQTRGDTTTRITNSSVPSPDKTPIPVTTPPITMEYQQNPTSSTTTSVQTTATGLPVTAAPVDSSGDVNPQPFTLTVSPASASGKPGETITYTLRIGGGEGQSEPIHFTLKASAFIFSETYDIGDEQPPFPKVSVYQFTIPSYIPLGTTINGVLTATGAGQTREQLVTLTVN